MAESIAESDIEEAGVWIWVFEKEVFQPPYLKFDWNHGPLRCIMLNYTAPYTTRTLPLPIPCLKKVRLLTRQSSLASISTQVQDFWQRAFVCLCVCAFVRLPPRNAKFFQTLANFRSSCLFLPRLSFKHRGEIGVRIAFLKTCLNACAWEGACVWEGACACVCVRVRVCAKVEMGKKS